MSKDALIRVTWHPEGEPEHEFTWRAYAEDIVMGLIGMTMAGAVITKVEEVKE